MKMTVNPEIRLRSRLRVLHGILEELTEGFLGELISNARILETLKKGVLDRQILKEITFHYMNINNEKEATISMNIDWDSHKIFASTGDGKSFNLEAETSSLRDQIAGIYSILIQHTEQLVKALDVVSVKVYYKYRDEIARDPAKDAESDIFLGVRKVDKVLKNSAINRDFSSPSMVSLEYQSRNLKELSIKIEHRRPRLK
jgi:hypothetical protein